MSMGSTIALIKALAPVADPEVIEQAVSDWLDDHPEAVAPIDDTAGEGDTDKLWSADKTAGEVATLTEAITPLTPSATSGDVGKFLKAKTVSGGKVTEYEFGEASGGGGLSNDVKAALIACFEKVAWSSNDGWDYYADLYEALYGEPPAPQNPYEFYDWLQSDESAFIDTGLPVTTYGDDGCERTVTFKLTSFARGSQDYPYITGAASGGGTSQGFYICGELAATDKTIYVQLCKQYNGSTFTVSSRDEIVTIKTVDKKVYYNDTLIYTGTDDTGKNIPDVNIPLFTLADRYSRAVEYGEYYVTKPTPCRIYEYTVKNGSGTTVAHMIPAKRRSDNAVGMYDTVRDTFFTNANSVGAFTIGND